MGIVSEMVGHAAVVLNKDLWFIVMIQLRLKVMTKRRKNPILAYLLIREIWHVHK